MAEVKVFYDRDGKTLTVWFTDRSQEYVCEETGDEVVLIGCQGRAEISATELAAWSGTIPWEVLTAITYRVRRVYRGSQAS